MGSKKDESCIDFYPTGLRKYLAVVPWHPPDMGISKNEKIEQIYEFSPTRSFYPQFSATYPQDLGIAAGIEYFCTIDIPVYMGVAFLWIISIIHAVRFPLFSIN
jgi:hypothetical protein